MEVYDLFAEKVVIQALLEALYRHRGKQKDMKTSLSRHCARKPLRIRKPASVNWLTLPVEVWLRIFSYLSQAELYFIVHAVCKSFHHWSRDFSLWTAIDFHKMHLDMELMSKRGLISSPVKICNYQISNLLSLFRTYLTSVNMSRFTSDCELNETSLTTLCMCSSITKLDIGFCNEADMISKIAVNCTMLQDFNAEGCR